MVVVIAVIVILLALVVPAATQMWNQRAISDAENALSGLLMTTRAKAMQGDMSEVGLFFFVDKNGAQQVATIARNPVDPARPAPAADDPILQWRTNPAWQDVFTIIGEPRALPSSMRVAPRKMIEESFQGGNYRAILANEDLGSVSVPANNLDRHRNFFVFLYSTSGEPLHVNPGGPPLQQSMRNVLIRDRNEDSNNEGDVTGLTISGSGNDGEPMPAQNLYNATASPPGSSQSFQMAYGGDAAPIPTGLIVDPNNRTIAMSFRTVDGLLVYDDALLREAGTDAQARAAVLRSTAQPFYVSRLTGAVVKGPQGENPNPTP